MLMKAFEGDDSTVTTVLPAIVKWTCPKAEWLAQMNGVQKWFKRLIVYRLAIDDKAYFNDANMCDELATCAMVHPRVKDMKWLGAIYDARNVWDCFPNVKKDRGTGS